MRELTFDNFSEANLKRCEHPKGFNHNLKSWSASDWVTATLGELGEAANIVKKLNRVRDSIPGNKETPEQLKKMLADELADTFIYLDLLVQSLGLNMRDIVVSKFVKTSVKIGYETHPESVVNDSTAVKHKRSPSLSTRASFVTTRQSSYKVAGDCPTIAQHR